MADPWTSLAGALAYTGAFPLIASLRTAPGLPLTWILAIGSEGLCASVQPRRCLLGDGPRWQRPRVRAPRAPGPGPPHTNAGCSFVEFENAADLRTAVEKLDGREFKGQRVNCIADVRCPRSLVANGCVRGTTDTTNQTQPDFPPRSDRGRSRSPRGRAPYNGAMPPGDDYRRGPPRAYGDRGGGYSPRREDYREAYRDRSPRARPEYYDDRRYGRSPPRRGPPMDEFAPPRGRYDDPYRRDYGPPPPPDPYVNGGARPYDRPPRDFPPRDPGYGPRDGGGYPRDDYRRGGGGGGGGGGYW